jgi:hypothetical protein
LFTTCKKQWKQTFVEGRLTEYYTGKSIANIELVLYGLTYENKTNKTERIVEKTITDASGHFKFSNFNAYRDKDDNYSVSLKNSDLSLVVDGKIKDSSPYIIKGKKNNMELMVMKKCYIAINFQDIDGGYQNNKLCFKFDYSNEKIITTKAYENLDCYNGYQLVRIGEFFSKNILLKYSWNELKNDSTYNYLDSLKVNNDTTITINY